MSLQLYKEHQMWIIVNEEAFYKLVSNQRRIYLFKLLLLFYFGNLHGQLQ